MKIELDLSDILGNEYGDVETLASSIVRQIADTLSKRLETGILKKVDEEISERLDAAISEAVCAKMPDIINDVLTTEYQPVSQYGDKKEKTTFRAELVRTITTELVYKPTRYEQDKNMFTKTIDGVMAEKLKELSIELKTQITTDFAKKALEESVKTLKKSLGLEAK